MVRAPQEISPHEYNSNRHMSFDIDWQRITSDNSFNVWLSDFLNERLSSIQLPEHLSDLKVERCSLGERSPEITVRDISAPFPEFYPADKVDEERHHHQHHHHHLHQQHLSSQDVYPNVASLPTGRNGRTNVSKSAGGKSDTDLPRSNSSIDELSNNPSKQSSPFLDKKESSLNGSPFLHTRFGALDLSRSPSPMPSVIPVGLYQQPFPSPLKMKQHSNSQSSTGYFPNVNGVGIGGLGSSYRSSNSSTEEEGNPNNGELGSGIELGAHLMNPANISIDGTNDPPMRLRQRQIAEEEERRRKEKERIRLEQQRYYNQIQIQKQKEDDIKLQKRANDVQLSVEVKFDGDIYIEVTCNLLLNYPSTDFIKLPIRLKITDLLIHSLGIVTYIDKRVYLSFLCDINDTDNNGREESRSLSTNGMNPSDFVSTRNRERIDIIKRLRIQGELGSSSGDSSYREPYDSTIPTSSPLTADSPSSHSQSNFIDSYNSYASSNTNGSSSGSVLRNIGKIEKFLLARLREIMISELAWPSWIELDFNDDDSEDEDGDDGPGAEYANKTDADGINNTARDEFDQSDNTRDGIDANSTPINLSPIATLTPSRSNMGKGLGISNSRT